MYRKCVNFARLLNCTMCIFIPVGRVLSSLAGAAERQMIIDEPQTKILSMYCNFCNIHRPRTITEFHQTMVYSLILTYCCALS